MEYIIKGGCMPREYNIEMVKNDKTVIIKEPGNIDSQELRESISNQAGCSGQVKKEMSLRDANLKKFLKNTILAEK
jgi:hypothetical protein